MMKITSSGFTSMKPVVAALNVSTTGMRNIGLNMRSRMQKRLDGGKDHNGAKFKKYGANTLAYKQKHGKSGVVNLEDTGNMRRQLTVTSKQNEAEILLQGDRREVGLKHQLGIGVPRRQWFGYTNQSADRARQEFAAIISRQVDKA